MWRGQGSKNVLPHASVEAIRHGRPNSIQRRAGPGHRRTAPHLPRLSPAPLDLARKLLNLFLRDCLYNRYLSDANRPDDAEHLFELPLDSYTGKALRKAVGKNVFVRWAGVGGLTAEPQNFCGIYFAGVSGSCGKALLAFARLRELLKSNCKVNGEGRRADSANDGPNESADIELEVLTRHDINGDNPSKDCSGDG